MDINLRVIDSSFTGLLNVGTGKEITVVELFNILKEVSRKDSIEEVHGPAKEGEQKRSQLSYEMAKKALGWQPSGYP